MAGPFPTREDLFNVGARELLARQAARPAGKRITAAAVYTTGTNVNSLLAGGAAMADEATRRNAIRHAELYLDSAEGEALDRVVMDHVDQTLARKRASRAVVPLRIARENPVPGIEIPAGAIVRAGGLEFRTVAAVTFAPGSVPPGYVDADALLAGTAGNVDVGAVTAWAQSPGDGIAVTNLEPAAGGGDDESDQDYLTRAKLARVARKGGLLEAIRLGALSVAGVKSAIVEEDLDSNGDPSGLVYVYIADAYGRANQALARKVRQELLDYRAAGIVPRVIGCSPIYQAISYLLPFEPWVNLAVAGEQLKQATVALVNQLQPRQPLERSLLYSIARTIPGAIVQTSAVAVPASDVVPLAAQVIRTRLDLVQVNGA